MVLTVMMTTFFHVPHRGGSVLLAGLRDVIKALRPEIRPNLPVDPRTVSRQLRLDPVTERFICCPKCWALSPFIDKPVFRDIPLCQEKLTPGSNICGEELWTRERLRDKVNWSPKQTYVHQTIKQWLGRLLSRPGIEDILDQYPMEASRPRDGKFMGDLWSSPAIQDLKGPDGSKLFLKAPNGEGRYLVSYAVDGFNPFHNKTAKQVVTTTGFWLILFNFPIHLRYLLENMCYVGSAAGPNGPTVGRLNPFLDLMVEELLELWAPGVFFTRTHKYESGRTSRAMLIPLTADMLAAREAAGLTSTTSTYFCVGCHLDMAHIEEFVASKWPLRSHSQHMQHANAWRDASTEQERNKLVKKTGIRYTPLLRLPYWNIVRYILIEPMHALDLGLIQHHCRELFRIDLAHPGGDASEPRINRPSRVHQQTREAFLKLFLLHHEKSDFLPTMLDNNLTTYRVLWHICNDLNLRVAGNSKKRAWFLVRIKKWVITNSGGTIDPLKLTHFQKDENHVSDAVFLKSGQVAKEEPLTIQHLILEAEAGISAKANSDFPTLSETDVVQCQKCIKAIYRGTKFTNMKKLTLVQTCHLRSITSVMGKNLEDPSVTREVLYNALANAVSSIWDCYRLPICFLISPVRLRQRSKRSCRQELLLRTEQFSGMT